MVEIYLYCGFLFQVYKWLLLGLGLFYLCLRALNSFKPEIDIHSGLKLFKTLADFSQYHVLAKIAVLFLEGFIIYGSYVIRSTTNLVSIIILVVLQLLFWIIDTIQKKKIIQ